MFKVTGLCLMFLMEFFIVVGALALPLLGTLIWAFYKLIKFIRLQHSTRSILQVGVEIVTLPLSFSAIFLQKRKEKQLPLYFQYFLKFTRVCSQIPYFHFFPKFVVATIAEVAVHFVTHEPLLTALIYTWSMFFLITITAVESIYGEFEEDVVTLANKIFLYCVSTIVIVMLALWAFAWDWLEPYLDNAILRMMAKVADFWNEKMWELMVAFWGWPISIKFLIALAIFLYIASSLYLSRKGIK